MNKIPASCLILTYNEEEKVEACLESVSFFSEVLVLDSYSTDRTLEIARRHTSSIHQRPWDNIVSQKQYGLNLAHHEWVLNVDADERLSVELQCEIARLFEEHVAAKAHLLTVSGFYIPRQNLYNGVWLRYGGWYPDYKLRLFRKSRTKAGGTPPHDEFQSEGKTETLKNPLIHASYSSLSEQILQIDRFSNVFVQQQPQLNFRWRNLLFKPLWKFFSMYVLKRGFLDGTAGWMAAVYSAFSVFTRQAKLWEREWKRMSRREG